MSQSSLQNELKQRQTFDSPQEEALLNIMRTQSVLMGPVAALLKEHHLSLPLFNILRILRGAGERGARVHDVGERMIAREPDTTRLIDRLENQGLARRQRCKEDRRVVYVRITTAGLHVLDALDLPLRDLHQTLLGHLTPADLAAVNRLMTKARRPHLGQ